MSNEAAGPKKFASQQLRAVSKDSGGSAPSASQQLRAIDGPIEIVNKLEIQITETYKNCIDVKIPALIEEVAEKRRAVNQDLYTDHEIKMISGMLSLRINKLIAEESKNIRKMISRAIMDAYQYNRYAKNISVDPVQEEIVIDVE